MVSFVVASQCNPIADVPVQGQENQQYEHPTKKCPEYTEGKVVYRCKSGMWSQSTDRCRPLEPMNFSYNVTDFELFINHPMVSVTPSVKCYGCMYLIKTPAGQYYHPSLPAGISLDSFNGIISGTPTELKVNSVYTIIARNEVGDAEVVISVRVMNGCAGDGIWPGSLHGKTAVLDCQGDTIGKMTRECSSTGWKDADSTYCLPKYHTNDTKGYVDWVYRFTYAKYSGFKNDKNNQLVKVILSAYKIILNDGEVALNRISQGSITDSVDVQVRVDCDKSRANSLYKILTQETSETDRTKKPVLQIMKNKDAFIRSESKDWADLIFAVNPTYNTVKNEECKTDPPVTPSVDILTIVVINIVVDIVVIVVIVVIVAIVNASKKKSKAIPIRSRKTTVQQKGTN